jgi:nucleoside-diphosphate-sugar epimerase
MVTLPPPGYLRAAQDLCRQYCTLFVADEIQTGLGRTGRWFALEHDELEPDFVLVGKALSGGYMPVAAMVTTREIFQRAVGKLERSYVHQSTYGRNRLSMAAGLAAIRVIERDGLVEHSARVGGLLASGLAELRDRHELISDVRGRGLMIGIELGAPDSRVARLNWRLIHLASEGLFPQLIVIPLHRDHGVITMAAGKNDVIKLLPPLSLSENEAGEFLGALDAVLTDCEGRSSRNYGEVRKIATTTLRRRLSRDGHAPAAAPFRGTPVDPARGDVCLVTGASGFVGGHLAERLVREGYQVRCLVRAGSDTRLLEPLDVELAVGDLTSARSLRRATDGCRYVLHCGALVSDWATVEEITRINVGGTRDLLAASLAASVKRFVHFSTTDVYGYPGGAAVDETYQSGSFANWYAQTKLGAEGEVRRAASVDGLETVILRPATIYGPRSVDVVGEIARAIRGRNMVLVGGGRAVAGLVYVENLIDVALLALREDAAPGQAFNVSDGLDVTWKQFTDGLADGLGCPPVRWSMPYWLAHGLGFMMEHGYRAARRATRVRLPPLLSRQAVHVLGRAQRFDSAKARDVLGWEPRIGYEDGLRATVEWLQAEHAGHEASSLDN